MDKIIDKEPTLDDFIDMLVKIRKKVGGDIKIGQVIKCDSISINDNF